MKNAFLQYLECKFTLTTYKLTLSLVCEQFCWVTACCHEELLEGSTGSGRRGEDLCGVQAGCDEMLTSTLPVGMGTVCLSQGKSLHLEHPMSYLLVAANHKFALRMMIPK